MNGFTERKRVTPINSARINMGEERFKANIPSQKKRSMHKEWISFSNHMAVGKSEAPVPRVQSDVRMHDKESSKRRGKILEVFWRKKKSMQGL